MIDKDSTTSDNYVVNVKVLDVEKRYRPGPKHYVYVIQVTWSNPANTFIIYRRYTQFFDLQCKLLDLFAEAPSSSNNSNTQSRQIPFLPGKIFLGRSQIRQIALERKIALNIYCQNLVSLPERISRSRPVLDFFQTLPTDVQNPIELSNNDKKSVAKTSLIISGPSRLPTYRCISDFTAVEKTEMSLKRNTIVQVIHKHLNGWWFIQNGDRTGFVPGAFLDPIEQQNDVREMDTLSRTTNETYVVNKSYQAKHRDEISLDQGSFITVLEKSFTGWWIVKFNDLTGRFPAIYLTSCKGRTIPEHVPKVTIVNPSIPFIQRLSSSNSYEQNENGEHVVNTEPELFYVHNDFFDDIGDCVSLQRGDIVEIHEKHSSGWWFGRRLKDDYVLTWIPSAFLQKEPISDVSIDETANLSSSSTIYLNVVPETNNIYQNIEDQMSKKIIYTEVRTNVVKHPANNDNEADATKISVRDLVQRFNQQ